MLCRRTRPPLPPQLWASICRITTMPASISYSSVPPKFPDKQRRPGIIQLPQPLTSSPMAQHHQKRNSLSSLPAPAHLARQQLAMHKLAAQAQSQLRTPEPSPKRRNNQQQRSGSPPRRQTNSKQHHQQTQRPPFKQPPVHRAPTPPSPGVVFELPAFEFPKRNVVDPAPVAPLSPPPTPVPEHRKKLRAKPGLSLAKLPHVSLASPPLSPSVFKVRTCLDCLSTLHLHAHYFLRVLSPISQTSRAAVATSHGSAPVLLPPFDLNTQPLLLDDDDDVILVPQGSSPPQHRRPSPPPSPAAVREWETIKTLPRLDAQTVAFLKETYHIQSSKPSEPVSVPSTPGIRTHPQSRPIPIARRATAAHLRSPSLPLYPTSSRAAMAQMREEVAQVFDLDSEDVTAVAKAADAWRAYAGSTFNDSPEEESTMRAPAPRFLSRMFN